MIIAFLMIFELPDRLYRRFYFIGKDKMSLTLILGATFFFVGAVAYFWNQIRESYVNSFAPWIRKVCGEEIQDLCNKIFIGLDENIRFIRRNIKKIKDVFQNIICKYDLTYTSKTPEQTEVKETVVVRQNDGSFVQRQTKSTVDNDEIPFSIIQKIYESDDASVSIDCKEVIEEQISTAMNA